MDQFLVFNNEIQFVELACDPKGDLAKDISKVKHPTADLLSLYKEAGVPVIPTHVSFPWIQRKKETALAQGCHKSTLECMSFENLFSRYDQEWVLLPVDLVKDHPNLAFSPPGVVLQWDYRPRTILDYSYFLVNDDTSKLSSQTAI